MGKGARDAAAKRVEAEMNSAKTQLAVPGKIEVDGEKLQKGLAKLVLTVVDLLRQILEKQAQRRIAQGTLTEQEVERLGMSFMQIKQRLDEVAGKFDIKPEELNLGIGQLLDSKDMQRQASLADLVDKILDRGTVIGGEITISVADVDLIVLNIIAMLSSVRPIQAPKEPRRNHR
ncbi:gas vesicle protein K [Candidatus Nitrosotenuis cloacae]|uniref:gas vesicle protein K n=1 Tax=Candidatus Nitrosotenuis cloacae TaxID=1603555 RepID=UPI00227FC90E|nr:gas vesicle protein K [Candidatus Nitrosotenuis cloacae]